MAMSRPPNPRSELSSLTSAPSRLSASWRSSASCHRIGFSLEGVAEPLPGADSAVHHVQDLARAEALHEARRDGAALAGTADRRHRARRVDALRQPVDVVIRDVKRARDVAPVPLALLAHVE